MRNLDLSEESPLEDYEATLTTSLNNQLVIDAPIDRLNDEYLFKQQIKRLIDVFFSLTVLLFFGWLYLIIAVLIRVNSKGNVIFKQKRTGKDGQEFWCYKFRTMVLNEDSNHTHANKNDQRITPIGNFLRKSSLDELPQFYNVLTGSMSVVGPRPHMLKHTEEYSRKIENFMVRHTVKPGITGWAQIKGYRGNTIQDDMMKNRVDHDIWYLQNWSNALDVKIILLTVKQVFKGHENAY